MKKKQKLVEWATEFGVNVAKYQSHKSEDDAIMTMLCLKAECMRTGQSVEQILTSPEGKGCFVSNEQILEQAAERAYRREMTEKIKRLYGKQSPMPHFKTVLGERFELDNKILRDVDSAFELVKRIYDNGGITGEHLTGRGTAVFISMPNPEHLKKLEKRGLKVMLLEELEAKLK